MYINKILSHSQHDQTRWFCKNDFQRDVGKNYAICRARYHPSLKIMVKLYIADFVVVKSKIIEGSEIIITESTDGQGDFITDECNVCEARHEEDGMDGGYGLYYFLVEYSDVPTPISSNISELTKQIKYYDDLYTDYKKNKEYHDGQMMIPNLALIGSKRRKLNEQYRAAVIALYS